MQDPIGIPACFTLSEKMLSDDPAAVTRSGQSVLMSAFRTKIADQSRLITITWCKNLLLHGLSISVDQQTCKVELKPWYFWRKLGTKRFTVDGKSVDVFWDLRNAKFNGETEPSSEYYVAVVYEDEVVLLVGDHKKDAYRRTGCRPALIDPILVSRKEHVFGKKKFCTRAKLWEKAGKLHEIWIECKGSRSVEGEMEIRVDGEVVINVKHLEWKFRGNASIFVNKLRVDVYWDVHDWLFSPGLRHALFIFKPVHFSSPPSLGTASFESVGEEGSSEFCLFLYAWKME